MLPIAALPPRQVRVLLERVGYELIGEDDYHWAFASRVDEAPVLVPRKVFLVPAEVTRAIINKTGFERYSDFLYELENPWPDREDEPAEE